MPGFAWPDALIATEPYEAPAGWSASGEQLLATYRHKGEWLRADVDAGMSRLGGAERFVGLMDVAAQLGFDSSIGISAQRDWVDSRLGIERAMTYDSVAQVGDHAFNNTFNVGLAAGQTSFSEGNRRPFLRTRWNVSLIDAVALNAYLKTRCFKDTNPNRPEYFSPARLNELSLGLSARVAAGHASLIGGFDAGRHTRPARPNPSGV